MSHFNLLLLKLLLWISTVWSKLIFQKTSNLRSSKQLLDSRDLGKTDIKHSTVLFWYELDIELGALENAVEFKFKMSLFIYRGHVVAQWLRCCATNWKFAGSNPDGVIGIFHWHNPSSCIMALGSTQPLTEMSTRNISWG
jgi:hypothetical protein